MIKMYSYELLKNFTVGVVSIQIFSFLFVDVNIHLGNDETNKVAPETIPSTARVIQVSEMPSPIHRLSKKLDQLTVYVNEVLIFFIFSRIIVVSV